MQKLIMVVVALGATGAYMALAVWAEGGVHAFLAHGPLIAIAVITAIAAVIAPFTSGNLSAGVKEERDNRWVIVFFAVVGLLTGYLPAWSDRTGTWVIGGEAVRWTGVAVYAVGTVLRMAPVVVLGRRFSGLVAIQPGHELVTDGLYGVVRNPSYVGLIVATLGWGLAFRSLVGVALTLLLIPPLAARMNAEERLLAGHFGAAYEAYRARTWRLIPWVY